MAKQALIHNYATMLNGYCDTYNSRGIILIIPLKSIKIIDLNKECGNEVSLPPVLYYSFEKLSPLPHAFTVHARDLHSSCCKSCSYPPPPPPPPVAVQK